MTLAITGLHVLHFSGWDGVAEKNSNECVNKFTGKSISDKKGLCRAEREQTKDRQSRPGTGILKKNIRNDRIPEHLAILFVV